MNSLFKLIIFLARLICYKQTNEHRRIHEVYVKMKLHEIYTIASEGNVKKKKNTETWKMLCSHTELSKVRCCFYSIHCWLWTVSYFVQLTPWLFNLFYQFKDLTLALQTHFLLLLLYCFAWYKNNNIPIFI